MLLEMLSGLLSGYFLVLRHPQYTWEADLMCVAVCAVFSRSQVTEASASVKYSRVASLTVRFNGKSPFQVSLILFVTLFVLNERTSYKV